MRVWIVKIGLDKAGKAYTKHLTMKNKEVQMSVWWYNDIMKES